MANFGNNDGEAKACQECMAIDGGELEGCDICEIFRYYNGRWWHDPKVETKEQGTQTKLNIWKNELIEWCCECCSTMAFKINEWQDPFYDENGIRRRECLGCGRYAEETISTDPKKTEEDDD